MLYMFLLFTGDYSKNCFQTGDVARFNHDTLSAAVKAELQEVGYAIIRVYITFQYRRLLAGLMQWPRDSYRDGDSEDYYVLIVLFMVAIWNRADHYIFCLWFLLLLLLLLLLLSSFFFLLFSSPNLSRRRLDVCHTSTHGVALM